MSSSVDLLQCREKIQESIRLTRRQPSFAFSAAGDQLEEEPIEFRARHFAGTARRFQHGRETDALKPDRQQGVEGFA